MIIDDRKYKVLIVEDNPGDYILIDEYLHETIQLPIITHAIDFNAASAILFSSTDFDVVLLDLTLPDVSGQQLITAMLKLVQHCPIIILTGYSDIALSTKYISQGVSDYLIKDDLNSTMLYKSIIYSIERRNVIEELKHSKKRYSDLFQLSTQPMWVYDLETLKIVQVNKAAIELYGYTNEEFLQFSILDLRPKEDIPSFLETINRIRTNKGAVNNGKFRHKKKSGELMDVETFSSLFLIDERPYRSVIAIDVTEKNLNEQRILKTIIKTQEDERYEIGGELHDNVGQILVSSLINMGMLKKFMNPDGQKWFDECKENINSAIKEIRDLSHRIAPKFFDDTTLFEATRRLFASFNVDSKYIVNINFSDEAKKYPLKTEVQLHLYRVLQEQLKNILKYAEASNLELDISIDNGWLFMTLEDDGGGFDKSTSTEGIGFANIRRRIDLLSGIFKVNSSKGNGCKIEVAIPL